MQQNLQSIRNNKTTKITTFLIPIICQSQQKRNTWVLWFLQQLYLLDSLKFRMYPASRPSFQQEIQEEYYCNPIRQHLRKGKNRQVQPQTQLRFKDLSKDKVTYHSGVQLSKDKSFKELLRRDSQVKIEQVKRRLQFQSASNSMEKSMTFSDIVRLSRDKKLREQSRSKIPSSKVTSSTSKQTKVFNVLKARLMGENNPNASNIQPQISKPPKPLHIPTKEELQMVRISSEFCNLSDSLSMRPF